jgi:hypothetical protein
MKKALLLALFFCHFNLLSAQIFFKQDSANKKSIFQIELGGYYGVHHIKPITPGFTYTVNDGYDIGVMANVIANITPHWSLGLGVRNSNQSAMIGMKNDVFIESFHLNMKSNQVMVMAGYHIEINKKEIFNLIIGLSKQDGLYLVSNSYYFQYIGRNATITGDQFIHEKEFRYYTANVKLNKELTLASKTYLIPFFEIQFYNTPLVKKNGVNLGPEGISYINEFRQINSRIGISLLLN